jgi:hypothetical protein
MHLEYPTSRTIAAKAHKRLAGNVVETWIFANNSLVRMALNKFAVSEAAGKNGANRPWATI